MPIDALSVLCVQFTRDLFAIAKLLFMCQQDGIPAPQHATPSLSWSERDARNASSSIGACVRVHEAYFEHEF